MAKRLILWTILAVVAPSHADELPSGIVDTQNPSDRSLTPAESLSKISLPDGFKVTLFAGEPDIRRPIAFDLDDRGRLWVVENYSHPNWEQSTGQDRIVILEDTDHDGRFDRRKVFFEGGRYLSAIAYGHAGVWIGNSPELQFIPDADQDDVPDSAPVVKLDGFAPTGNNMLNNFHWGPDGWLYGAVGYAKKSIVGPPGTPHDDRATMTRGIWRFHPVHNKFDVLARGMVNPWGADFNEYGDLITSNTVNAHLWHIVPGMYCQRRASERENPYAYARIKTIADHLHWGGGTWQSSRDSTPVNSVAGGGHAHCGGMVYLGDNWPKRYRGTFFTVNLHGNRINNDRLVPNRSSYIGTHEDDFLLANDPWFRGLTIKYGPDGGVYVSDWHDLGECHDKDGSHRSSGRIFKITYMNARNAHKGKLDFHRMSGDGLAILHGHPNEWMVRRARRNLHERYLAGKDLEAAPAYLRDRVADNDLTIIDRLRAYWTLQVIGGIDVDDHLRLTRHPNEHIRRWAVRFLAEPAALGTPLPTRILTRFAKLARTDDSPRVRLELASVLQRLQPQARWETADGLLSHAEDAVDQHIPLMVWYAVEPLVTRNLDRSLALACRAKIPIVRQYIARRALDVKEPPVARVIAAILSDPAIPHQQDFVRGMIEALQDGPSRTAPANWTQLYSQLSASRDESLNWMGIQLATIFGDKQAVSQLSDRVRDRTAPVAKRRQALQALLRLNDRLRAEFLHQLVRRVPELRADAISALTLRSNNQTAVVLLDQYQRMNRDERRAAINVLVAKADLAIALLRAIEAGNVPREDVTAYELQQLRSFRNATLRERVQSIWKDDSQAISKADQIARYKELMNSEFRLAGNAVRGRAIFEKNCAQCHALFGEGGTLGPDLTGSGRKDLDYVLRNLVDPSAEIDPAYRQSIVETDDGRILAGFVIEQTDNAMVINTKDGRVKMPMKKVESIETSALSMMPEGLLRQFREEEIRDLILYLASPEQVELSLP